VVIFEPSEMGKGMGCVEYCLGCGERRFVGCVFTSGVEVLWVGVYDNL